MIIVKREKTLRHIIDNIYNLRSIRVKTNSPLYGKFDEWLLEKLYEGIMEHAHEEWISLSYLEAGILGVKNED